VELTDRFLRSLQWDPTRGRNPIWDLGLPNFGVRVSETGRRSFVVVRRAVGSSKPSWNVIGSYPGLGLKEARERARDIRALLQQGRTPKQQAADLQRQQAERLDAEQQAKQQATQDSFSAVAEDFIRTHLRHLRSGKRTTALIRQTLVPRFGDQSIASIRTRDIAGLLSKAGAARLSCNSAIRAPWTDLGRNWSVGSSVFNRTGLVARSRSAGWPRSVRLLWSRGLLHRCR
jgi:hypothetical protein